MRNHKLNRLNLKRRQFLPYFSLIAVLVATAGTTLLFYQNAYRTDQLRFESATRQITARLEKILIAESAVLSAVRRRASSETLTSLSPPDPEAMPESVGLFVLSGRSAAATPNGGRSISAIVMPSKYGERYELKPAQSFGKDFEKAFGPGGEGVAYIRLDENGSNSEGALVFYTPAVNTPEAESVPFYFTLVTESRLRRMIGHQTAPLQVRTTISAPGGSITIPSLAGNQENQPLRKEDPGNVDANGLAIRAGFATLDAFHADSQLSFTIYIPVIGTLLGLLIFGLVRIEVNSRIELSRIASALDDARAEKAALLLSEKEARKQAEASNRAKDEFMATISHEIRTPLNAIAGWANMLEGESLPDASRKEAFRTIKRNVKKQSNIINELLLFSSLNSRNKPLDKQVTSASEIVDKVIDTILPAVEEKRISLATEERLSDVEICCDREKLATALLNLAENAVKFTPSGGKIGFSSFTQHGCLRLLIRDSGPGIRKEFLPHIFEKFRQSDQSTTRQFGGLGLGLAIARKIINLHGGTVSVRSDGENSGAEFDVQIPLATDLPSGRSRGTSLTSARHAGTSQST